MLKKELPQRKKLRLTDYDYSSAGAYFITVCTQEKRQILSRINIGGDVPDAPQIEVFEKNPELVLMPYGEIADKYINQLNDFYENVVVDRYVIMPNHIHIMLFVRDNGSPRLLPHTRQHSEVSKFISTFKRFCNKEYGINIWQRHFNDHVIRNKRDYEEHIKYIEENPIRWYYDELYE